MGLNMVPWCCGCAPAPSGRVFPAKGFRTEKMATAAAGLAPAKEVVEKKVELLKEIRAHEVAIAELDNLNPSRFLGLQQAVYQKAGNIFFCKSVKSVITTEQSNRYCIASFSEQLDQAKARLSKLNQA
ncbi:hypothetical protein Zm00014a_044369 [Zea mays]|uniref:Uncharacterized protein n=1 Tax=Zea mays TaxID=4577 RepID=A0A3L6E349_MAIZE|nr:hypothetical protein Zm00014a_044369 [Zea mays]